MFSGNDTENYYFWSRLSISLLENSIFWFNLHFSINNEVNFSFSYTSFLHHFLCELFHHVLCPSLYWHMMGREAVWLEITRRIKRLFIHLDILFLLYPKMSSCEEGRPISYNSFGGKSQKSNSNYSKQKEQKKEFTDLVTDMPWCSCSFRCGLIKSLKQWLKTQSFSPPWLCRFHMRSHESIHSKELGLSCQSHHRSHCISFSLFCLYPSLDQPLWTGDSDILCGYVYMGCPPLQLRWSQLHCTVCWLESFPNETTVDESWAIKTQQIIHYRGCCKWATEAQV